MPAKSTGSYIRTPGFAGLNRRVCGGEGEMSDCENVASDNYPALCTSSGFVQIENEYTNIQAVFKISESGFCGAAKGVIYWNGENVGTVNADSEIEYLFQQGMLFIYEKKTDGFIYTHCIDTAAREIKMKTPNAVIWSSIYLGMDSSGYADRYVLGIDANATQQNNFVKNFTQGEELIIYGADNRYEVMSYPETRYEHTLGAAFCKVLSTNLAFAQSKTEKDGTAHTTSIGGVTVQFYSGDGVTLCQPSYGSDIFLRKVTAFKKIIPQMSKPVLYKNRVWGGSKDGTTIFASKWDDGSDFYLFDDLKDGSAYIEVSSLGEFTGFCEYNESLLCFKTNSITVIYGDNPANFSIGKEITGIGCVDIKSAKTADGVLYFCGYDGFYAYSGGQPQFISQKLNTRYNKCTAFVQDGKYYAEGTKDNGEKELIVYDTRSGIWLKEEVQDIKGICISGNDVYIYNASGIKKHNHSFGVESGDRKWFFESTDLYESVFERKGIQEFYIRAKLFKNTVMTASVIDAYGNVTSGKTFYGNGKITVYRVPVKFEKQESARYRISGSGAAVIYDIERKVSAGGRNIGE